MLVLDLCVYALVAISQLTFLSISNICTQFPFVHFSSGVYLKWLVLEHLYLTTSGRLQIGGLTGAVMVSHVATNGSYFGGDGGKTGSAGKLL